MTGNKEIPIAPRGMRDFYPDDMAIRNAIFETWSNTARSFGFLQYDSCVVETLDLLKRKAGEEIIDQIYSFTDKSGRELALRPEMTPTLARMIASRQGSLSFPLKWFCIAQCFRYERMSRGRKREHYQWNMDIVGEESVSAEAEIIVAGITALMRLGLNQNDFKVHFNSRALMADLFASLEIQQEYYQSVFLALDKRGKISDNEVGDSLKNAGLNSGSIDKVFSILDIASLDNAVDLIGENTPAVQNAITFTELIKTYGVSESLNFNIAVVRGLAYYTGIVFEAFDAEHKFRAIFGGGRYDTLLNEIGGTPASAVGMGFGDVVISELLADKKIVPKTTGWSSSMTIGYMNESQRTTAIKVASAMRTRGMSTDLSTRPETAKHFFSKADKGGYAKAIYIGPDDITSGKIRIKDMMNRSEQEELLADITTR